MFRRASYACVCLVVGALAGVLAINPLVKGDMPPATSAATVEHSTFRQVVKKILPAVVSIETHPRLARNASNTDRMPQQFSDDSSVPFDLRKFMEAFPHQSFNFPNPSPSHSFGSGFLVDAKGVILTNDHVVANAEEVVVELKDGRKFTSRDIKTDPKSDLAIVRIKAREPLPYLELGDSDRMEIGDRVLAVGAPFGLAGSVTHGIVSAKSRSLAVNAYEDFMQTDAPINPGNSGGPLVNLDGKVIGINALIKSESGGFQGVGMAIPSNLARNVMNQLVQFGVVHRGYLGVEIRNLNPTVALRLGAGKQGGVLLAKVMDDTPAARAGLRAGDVITSVAGKAIHDGSQLHWLVAGLPAGKSVDVTILRDGKAQTLQVKLAEQSTGEISRAPEPSKSAHQKPAVAMKTLGLEMTDMTENMAREYGYSKVQPGALVSSVKPNSLASEANLNPGAVIVEVDKTRVQSAEEARKALDKASLAKGVLLQIETPRNGTGYVLLEEKTNQ